ncbi:MAG: VWA domain-containing protein [Myxococcales bacterium]|nr:VWA domain-containing protein [Myxococcales bacterium]
MITRSILLATSVLGSALLGFGCSGGEPGAAGVCASSSAPAACGQACEGAAASACPIGFYCDGAQGCAADCTAPAEGCGAGLSCSAEGRCVEGTAGDAGGEGGVFPDGGLSDAAPDNICADVNITTTQVIPSVILIVDQSGSMESNDLVPGVTRWDALQDALVGLDGVDGGLVQAMQSQVRFGLALYSGDDTTCPILTTDPTPLSGVAVDGYSAIKAAYDAATPIRWTPTHLAIEQVLDQVLTAPPPDPVIFILATDGAPNECATGTSGAAEPAVITQVQRAYGAGIRTYVISLAGDDPGLQAHLDQVANAGMGADPATDPPAISWAPTDTAGLQTALTTIIGGTLSCTLTLNGTVTDLALACEGRVLLDGAPLECNGLDGWQLLDATHIEVLGAACDTLLSTPGSMLTAAFPCDVVIPI